MRSHALLAKIHLARDDRKAANRAIIELLRLDPDFQADEPPRFRRLLAEARRGDSLRVTSVSKTPESLREAPATVEVLTRDEIERRGYLDLEALLHDLPGFDISRGNGSTYSNIYQRGYRSPSTDRTLFLIDGVEQNDLTSNVAYISRQYPLSNIERIEVIYGPASTLYGANAFAGVINVITRSPASLLGSDGSAKNVGFSVMTGAGSWNTRYIDATVAARTPDDSIQLSLTGRIYQSDEPDLSEFRDWDYDPAFYDSFDYTTLGFNAEQAERARALDRAAYTGEHGGEPVGFSDITDTWYIGALLKISNLELGFQSWERVEGATPWYTDQQRPGAANGSVWAPEQRALYIRYQREVLDNLSLFLFCRYKVHGTTSDSSSFSLYSYAGGKLTADNLENGDPAFWKQTINIRSSNQLRNEIGVVYQKGPRFNLVAGLELRNGSIQANYVKSEPAQTPTEGGQHFDVRDLGAYAQATWQATGDLKIVAGGRFDYNSIQPTGGYGETFNPRLAAIFSPGRFTFKAMYSEAFKDASNVNKFGTVKDTRDLPNPDLIPEKATNLELSASYQDERLRAEVAVYDAGYSDVVGLKSVPFEDGTTTQFQNLGALSIRGAQMGLRWKGKRFDAYANYTHTDPRNTEPLDKDGQPRTDVDEVAIGDIARHRWNAGFHTRIGEHLSVNVGWNHVGDRKTGAGTTVPTNPNTRVEAYDVVRATITYKEVARGLDLQVLVQNLLDETYDHPGVREAGERFAALAPQPGRSVFVRATYRF